MDYKHWYAVTIQVNKERSTKAQLLARKALLHDPYLEEVEYLQRKEMKVDKGGRRKVKNKVLMPGYLLVKVRPQVIEHEDGTTSKVFPNDTFNLIVDTPGITRFANCNKDIPLPLRVKEAKKMFEMCDEAHLEVKQNLSSEFAEGDILDVVSGPFAGYKCEVMNIQGNKILGLLDMFGRVVPAEFTKEQVYKHETKTDTL